MNIDNTRQLQLDRESRGTRYYRNAVERHWDPHDIDLGADRERLVEFLRGVEDPERYFDAMRMGVAVTLDGVAVVPRAAALAVQLCLPCAINIHERDVTTAST